MDITNADYANTEAEFERILEASFNDCILPKHDINDILLQKSVYLYTENLLKLIVTETASCQQLTKCISCYTESVNVLNICKCGLENLCYSCFLPKYIGTLTETIKENRPAVIIDNTFNKKCMIEILKNTIQCKYCKTDGCFHDVLNRMNANLQTVSHVLNETEFLNMETKLMIDIFPSMKISSVINKKNMDLLTSYGFSLEYEEPILYFKLKPELIDTLKEELKYIRINVNIDTIKCNCKIITPAVFNAIYYKCIKFGIKNKELTRDFLFRWNKHCQKLNGLLDTYAKNVDKNMNYYITSVLINEINTMT